MVRLPAVVFAFVSLACAVPLQRADAAIFDFATLAETPGAQGGSEGFWTNQITTAGAVYTVGGIGVVASATGNTNSFSGAYLDGFSGGLPAGLGVCSTSGGCEGTSDDNVGRIRDNTGALTETLRLTFTTSVKLTDLLLRNQDHGVFVGSLMINGTLFTTATGELTSAMLAALSLGTTFDFFSLTGDDNRIAKDFYISSLIASPVPLPGALPLFATGLGALGLLGWRRKRKAAAQSC